MKISELEERYPDARLFTKLSELNAQLRQSDTSTKADPEFVRFALERLRAIQADSFVALAASPQLSRRSLSQEAVEYLPTSAKTVAELFLERIARQARVSGLMPRADGPELPVEDTIFYDLLAWFFGTRRRYPLERDYWMAVNQEARSVAPIPSSVKAVGPVLSVFMLGYCVLEESSSQVPSFAFRILTSLLESSGIAASDEWAEEAILMGGVAISRMHQTLTPP